MAERLDAGSLAARLGSELVGDPDVLITDVTHDSSRVIPGALFCCVLGEHHDGHDFADVAVGAGAVALLAERRLDLEVTQLLVEDVRSSMAAAAAAVHRDPADDLTVVGVTGTNGKTTVVSILAQILEELGDPPLVIGTLTGSRTTPEATDLQALFAQARDSGVRNVVMEVSSHALSLHRVDGFVFDVAVFTNLGQDHLDFHGTPEVYFAAKAVLFEAEHARVAVLNVDDVHGRLLRDASALPVREFSVAALSDLKLSQSGSDFTWHGRPVHLTVPGRHNVSNALGAAETALAIGADPSLVADALGNLRAVPGRFEVIDAQQPFAVVIDYAHTPEALRSVSELARDLLGEGGRLIIVFGCGGDRDPTKRAEMGKIATEAAEVVVLTNDNPRSEDPLRIISEIRTGCVGDPLVEPDRRAALALAISRARGGDVVLIAGKGHETGQEFADRTEAFDDREVARELLGAHRDPHGEESV